MKTYCPLEALFTMIILLMVLPCCSPKPTPVPPVYQLTLQPLSVQPTTTPVPTPVVSCTVDSDCVLAYRADQCCPCWSIYNRQEVENNRRLRYVDEPEGYRYEKWRLPRKVCPLVMCAPWPQPPFGLVCDAQACRAVETWQEIWSACSSFLDESMKLWCHANAATIAYQSGEPDQALMVCNSLQGNYPGGASFAEDCILQVGRSLMTKDPQASAMFCRAHLTTLLSNCLNETAFAIGRADVESALELCNEINTQTDNDRNQKDYCFHNLAMSVAKIDLVQARQICEMMSQDIEQCKVDAENPQGIP